MSEKSEQNNNIWWKSAISNFKINVWNDVRNTWKSHIVVLREVGFIADRYDWELRIARCCWVEVPQVAEGVWDIWKSPLGPFVKLCLVMEQCGWTSKLPNNFQCLSSVELKRTVRRFRVRVLGHRWVDRRDFLVTCSLLFFISFFHPVTSRNWKADIARTQSSEHVSLCFLVLMQDTKFHACKKERAKLIWRFVS
jgi:hypothetical protein